MTIAVFCLGQEMRGDDGVGLYVGELLKRKNLEDVHITTIAGAAVDLVEAWEMVDRAIVVDCCRGYERPGEIHRWEVGQDEIPAELEGVSSHGLGLADALVLAETMGTLPSEMIVYGIEGRNFQIGGEMGKKVQEAAETVADRIVDDVENWGK